MKSISIDQLYSETFLGQQLEQQRGKFVVHIALPKSGSTWLTKILGGLYFRKGWNTAHLVPAHGRRGQEIDPRLFIEKGYQKSHVFSFHQHCPYSEYTAGLLQKTGSKVIFQFRNIFDSIVSASDDIWKTIHHGNDNTLFPQGLQNLSKEEMLDYVVDVEAPGFIKFMEGWLNSDLVQQGKVFMVSYESLLKDPASLVHSISDEFSLGFTAEEIASAIQKASSENTRKNVAVTGRGRKTLSAKQIQKINTYLSYFDIASTEASQHWAV